MSHSAVQDPVSLLPQLRSSVRLAPMEDGINLHPASVCPPEEHPPVANPETKRRSSLYALDVANARSGVLIDPGNDAWSRWRVDPS